MFGCSQEQIDAWPWFVPDFSQDRNQAASVAACVGSFDGHREFFNRNLAALVPSVNGGLAESLTVCTPDDICRAALATIRECGPLKRSSFAGTDRHNGRREAVPVDSVKPSSKYKYIVHRALVQWALLPESD